MKFLCYNLLLLVILCGEAAFAQDYSDEVKQWPRMTLRLTGDMTMPDIFDSGFRPYRWAGDMGNYQISFKHALITVQTRNGTSTPLMPMERCEVLVEQPGNFLGRLEFFTPPLTLKEARYEMTKWLPYGTPTAAEMETFLAAVKADWLHYEYVGQHRVQFGTGWRDPDGVIYKVYFMNAYGWDTPLRVVFLIDALNLTYKKHLDSSKELLQPPPGYEGASMETPKDWGPDARYVPMTNEYRDPPGSLPPGVKLPDSLPDWEAIKAAHSNNNNAGAPTIRSEQHEASSRPWLIWLLLVIAATAGAVWLFLRKSK